MALILVSSSQDTVELGHPVRSELKSDVPLFLRFRAETTGPVTISLESTDFDPKLSAFDSENAVLGRNDEGGLEWNARLVLSLESGQAIQLQVDSKGGSGQFELKVVAGRRAPLEGKALLEAAAEFRAQCRERALDRGDDSLALAHLLRESELRIRLAQPSEAQPLLETCLAMAKGLEELRSEALTEKLLGNLAQQRGQLVDARRHQDRSLELYRELEDCSGEAAALGNLANAYLRQGDLMRAREHFEAQIARAKECGDLDLEGAGHGNLAAACKELGLYSKSLEHLELALSIFRRLGNSHHAASTLQNIGDLLSYMGRYPEARQKLSRALAAARELGDASLEVVVATNLGRVQSLVGDNTAAREALEEALLLARSLDQPQAIQWALANLGTVYEALGDYSSAERAIRERISVSKLHAFRIAEAWAHWQLGRLSNILYDSRTAETELRQALDLAREFGSKPLEASTLASLGRSLYATGKARQAYSAFEASLELARGLGDRLLEASVHLSLSLYWRDRNKPTEARAEAEQARRLFEKLGFRSGLGAALDHLSYLSLREGLIDQAQELAEKSLALSRQLGERGEIAHALVTLASIHLQRNQRDRAEALARDALELAIEVGRESTRIDALFLLADVSIQRGRLDACVALLSQANDLIARLTRAHSSEATANLRARWSAMANLEQEWHVRRWERADERDKESHARAGFLAAARWKGRALLEGFQAGRAGARDPELVQLDRSRRELLARRDRELDRLSEMILAGESSEKTSARRAEIEELWQQSEALRNEWADRSPRRLVLRGLDSESIDETIRLLLDEESVLVEFAFGFENLFAYRVSSRGVRLFDLGTWAPIKERVLEFEKGIGSPSRLASAREIGALGSQLFAALLAPVLADQPENVRRLIIVPSPGLDGLSFEALVMSDHPEEEAVESFDDIEFLIDAFEVSYGSSTPVLRELARLGPRETRGRVLVLADPVYPGEKSAGATIAKASSLSLLGGRGLDPKGLVRLEHTRREASELGRLLLELVPEDGFRGEDLLDVLRRRGGRWSSSSFDIHMGAYATPDVLREDLRAFSVLHLAAHGFVDPDFPMQSGLALTFREKEDGFFTVADVLDMQLDANLVVLSACETAQGTVLGGEGAQSLARAFMIAGARSVVASLWQVADRETADTMIEFYRGAFERGLSVPAALRAAKLKVRLTEGARGLTTGTGGASRRIDAAHPYYWAPFIHSGQAR